MKNVLFIALCILIGAQIMHLRVDFGIQVNPFQATIFAAAFIIAINVAYSAVFAHVQDGTLNGKTAAGLVAAMVLTFFASWISVNASVRAFAAAKHQMVMHQEAGPVAMLARNRMVRADNRLNELASAGVTSGAEYEKLSAEVAAGGATYASATGGKQEESAYSKAITGGDAKSIVDKKVQRQSWLQALGLEGLCAALSILLGIGKPLQRSFEENFGAPPKKSRGVGVSR